jgi:DNA-directed RNA polymerase subunit beta'
LSPAEYFASSYGTRKGLVATKLATADSGFFGKQLATAASDLVITEPDCGTSRGVQASTDDNDYVGTALAKDVGGYPAGTIVSPSILKEFRKTGVGSIPVRSASTCQAHSGGLCAKCAGIRERNRMPALMDNIGLAAASAVSEPLSQSQLATKHSAGVAGSTQNLVGGFKLINQLAQVPEVFQDKATVSEVDGPVTKVVDAPQGGKFVYVGQEEHYIPAEKNLKVRVGDQLEAGDVLSEGIVNPADVVRHKGIGEGRAYFVKTMQDAFSSSGIKTSKRNLEVLSRALINHVKISGDGAGDYLPDDIVNYSDFERSYQPREGAKEMDPREAQGHYLEKPVLHYSIGTRITPRVAKTLQDAQEIKVLTHPSPPVFEPQMVRLMEAGSSGKDWMAKMQGTGLKKNLMAEVQSGEAESDIHGLNPIPGIAKGTEFGKPPPGVVGY